MTQGEDRTRGGRGQSSVLTMLRKWALSVPVAWWYSITQQLLRISPLLSLPQECPGSGDHQGPHSHLYVLLPTALAAPAHSHPQHYLRVLSFFSRALACCSLMMVAFTWGGFMCTFSFPPTSSRTVAANLVCVFSTCGGCFSMMKVLVVRTQVSGTGRQSSPNLDPPTPAGHPVLPGDQGRDDVSDGAVQL